MSRKASSLLHVLTLLLGTGLLLAQALSLRTVKHDDAITLLAVTGHQAAFSRGPIPENRWVSAADWQAFWTLRESGLFRTIARDLAHDDIHPPLYFWLLHVWFALGGVGLAYGALLNVPLLVAASLAVTAAARGVGCPPGIAAAVGVLWLLPGAHVALASELRGYGLLAAVSALFLVALLRFLREPGRGTALGLGAATLLGMLTHYHFVLLLVASGSLAALQALLARRRRTLALAVSAVAAAALLFALLHPGFERSFARQAKQAGGSLSTAEVAERAERVLGAALELSVPPEIASTLVELLARHWLPTALAALLVAAALAAGAGRGLLAAAREWARTPAAIPPLGGALVVAAVALLFLLGGSERHAMGAKYLVVGSPLLFVALGQLLAALAERRRSAATALVAVLLVAQAASGSWVAVREVQRARRPALNPLADPAAVVVLDSTRRGVLPAILWHAHPAARVFASEQEDLLEDGLPDLEDRPSSLYISDRRHDNTRAGREEVLRRFEERGYVKRTTLDTELWISRTYELRREGVPSAFRD
jgi:hypothetical protein